MSLFIDAIRGYAPSSDDTTYSTDIYCSLLKRVREAAILKSQAFLTWACTIRDAEHFDAL